MAALLYEVNRFAHWMASLPAPVESAAIAAIVSLVTALLAPLLKYRLDLSLETRKLNVQYRAEQTKALRDRLVRYKGQFLEVAASLSDRLWNFYAHEEHGWLQMDGSYHGSPLTDERYYARSFAYRILGLLSIARLVERDAVYVDLTVVTPSDFRFVVVVKLMLRMWSNVTLLNGLEYDSYNQRDHIFVDTLRLMADAFRCDKPGELLLSPDGFRQALEAPDHAFSVLFRYLDDVRCGEDRYRFDRLVCVHLLLLAALDAYGYEYQRASLLQMIEVASRCEHRQILRNLVGILREWHLERDKSFRKIIEAVSRVSIPDVGFSAKDAVVVVQ